VTALLLAALLAAKPLACPPGTLQAGLPPPAGNAEWCEGRNAQGVAKRQGPARDWYEADLVHVESTWRDGQLDGLWVQFHRDGKKAAEGRYRAGEKHGPWIYWYEGGAIEEEVGFEMGRRHGRFVQWWRGGKKRTEGSFCFGLQCGRWTTWNQEGSELGTIVYEQIRATP
jgi:antitoxin component YwqK of YwqJK toxin-antitoxin module